MRAVTSVEALCNIGLQGDRYANHVGFWRATDACQITLISEYDLRQALKRASRELHEHLLSGHHRRNLVIKGLRSNTLEGRRFRIGTAVFHYHKPRPPCGYLDQIEGEGLSRALGRHSGVCLRVVTSGSLSIGDSVVILDPSV